jgi:hypothetical protein
VTVTSQPPASGTQPGPTVVTAAVTCDASLSISPQSNLNLVLSNAVFTVPNEPTFSTVLTNLAGPPLLNYLNNSILNNITIPPLSLLNVTLVPPVIDNETTPAGNNVLVGYTGLNPVTPPPAGQEWPASQVFVGLDATLIDQLANAAMPSPSSNGGSGPFTWGYSVTLSPQININPGAGNNVTITMNVSASADFTYHTPWILPNIDFGGSVSGSGTASANIDVAPSGSSEQISITITSVGDFDLNLSINGLPDWLTSLFSPIIDIFLDAVGSLVSSVLQNFSFTVYTLPVITLNFAGFPNNILQLQGVQLSQITGPAGNDLVVITATPDVQPAPSVRVNKRVSLNDRVPVAS